MDVCCSDIVYLCFLRSKFTLKNTYLHHTLSIRKRLLVKKLNLRSNPICIGRYKDIRWNIWRYIISLLLLQSVSLKTIRTNFVVSISNQKQKEINDPSFDFAAEKTFFDLAIVTSYIFFYAWVKCAEHVYMFYFLLPSLIAAVD